MYTRKEVWFNLNFKRNNFVIDNLCNLYISHKNKAQDIPHPKKRKP